EERVEIKTKQLSEKNMELEKLSLVASKTDNAVMVTDAMGKIDWVNDAFIRMIENREVIGKNVDELNLYHNIRKEITEAVSQKKSKIFESSFQTHDRTDTWISTTLTPVFD